MAYHLTPMPQHIQITIWVGTAKQRDLIMKTAPSFYYRYKAQDPLESLFIPQNPMAGSHPAPREGLTLRDCKVELGGAKQTIVQLVWLSPSHQKHLIASVVVTEVAGRYPSDDALLARKRANRAVERAGGKPSLGQDPQTAGKYDGLRYIREYCIARGSVCSANLVTQVNNYIRDGWVPQGGLVKDGQGGYYQALVRYS